MATRQKQSNMFIYTITNVLNGKTYIGQSRQKNVRKRWQAHRDTLNKNEHHNTHLQNAWNRDGETSFDFEILDTANNIRELDNKEGHYISTLDATNREKGYNKKSGGTNGYIVSDETRKRMRLAQLGEKGHNFGKRFSHDIREKMSKSAKGRVPWIVGKHHSDETRRKISETKRGHRQ